MGVAENWRNQSFRINPKLIRLGDRVYLNDGRKIVPPESNFNIAKLKKVTVFSATEVSTSSK